MMLSRRHLSVTVLLVALGLLTLSIPPTQAQDGGFVVIVNAANPATSISKKELSNLFLKKVTVWSHGGAAKPVDLGARSTVRDDFSRSVHGRPADAIKSFWQRQIFSGRSSPPPEVSSSADAVAFVAGDAGAVGYVASGTALGTDVKAIGLAD